MPREALDQFAPDPLATLLMSTIRKSVSEDPRLNRKYKRLLSSKSGLQEVIAKTRNKPLSKEDFPGIPVSDDFLNGNYIQNYIGGAVSRVTLSREFTRWITDPEYSIQILYEYSGKENPLETMINKAFANLESALGKLDAVMEEARSLRRQAKAAQSLVYKTLSELPEELREVVRPPKIPPLPTVPDIDMNFDKELGPGRSAHFNHYLKAATAGRLEPAPSDFGDLLHLIYLPDVDVMRCDRRISNLMKGCANIEREKIIGSLNDLPATVEQIKAVRPLAVRPLGAIAQS